MNDYLKKASIATASTLYVDINKRKYPSAVWPGGTKENPKQIVILDDIFSISGGDILPHFFLGDNQDGYIGNHTYTRIIGDIVGTVKGGASPDQKMPLPCTDPPGGLIFKNSKGERVSPYLYGFDNPLTSWKLPNGQWIFEQVPGAVPTKAPTLKGLAGEPPLPDSWETTVWLDIGGITPHPDNRLPGDLRQQTPNINDQTTWRDRWLEQAIRQSIKKIKIDDKTELKKKHSKKRHSSEKRSNKKTHREKHSHKKHSSEKHKNRKN